MPTSTELREKKCTTCLVQFPSIEKFFRKKKGAYKHGLYSRCRSCEDIYTKKFRKENRSKLAQKAKEHKRKLKEKGLCVQCGSRPALFTGTSGQYLCKIDSLKNVCHSTLGSVSLWEAMMELFEAQNGQCALSGDKIEIGDNAGIDHIIPKSRGGTSDISNLQWVTRDVNMFKYKMTNEEFLALCRRILNFNQNKHSNQ